jgi:hypothetical protein
MRQKTQQEVARVVGAIGMGLDPCVDERTNQPRPHRSLVIGAIAAPQITAVRPLVVAMTRVERPEAHRREQAVLDGTQY